MPVLENVLIEARDTGSLWLTATDLETGGMTSLESENSEQWTWKYTAPARLLLKYLKKIEESHITLYVENGELVIEHGDSRVSFAGIDAEQFPELPRVDITAEVENLRKAIPRTMIAISKEESRFTLNGALLDTEASTLVSTDGHRLSFMPVKITGELKRTIISRRALAEAERLLGKDRDSLYCGRDENHLILSAGNRTIHARVLTGNFPDYKRVMPEAFDHCVRLDSLSLGKAVKRLQLVAPDSGLIKFHVNGSLDLSTENAGTSKASAKVNIQSPETGLDWGTGNGFKAHYLEDFADAAGWAEVSFHFSDPTRGEKENLNGTKTETLGWKAAEWRTLDGWRYVVMPMRA
jgi:DNA polymerase III subunit beta